MEHQPAPPDSVPLLEAWMFGAVLYARAMRQVAEYPAANDT